MIKNGSPKSRASVPLKLEIFIKVNFKEFVRARRWVRVSRVDAFKDMKDMDIRSVGNFIWFIVIKEKGQAISVYCFTLVVEN